MPGWNEDPATSLLDSVPRSGSPPGTRRPPPAPVGIWKRDEVVFGACDDGGRRKTLAFSSSAAKRDVILPDKDYSNENLNRNLVCQLLAHKGCKAREL